MLTMVTGFSPSKYLLQEAVCCIVACLSSLDHFVVHVGNGHVLFS